MIATFFLKGFPSKIKKRLAIMMATFFFVAKWLSSVIKFWHKRDYHTHSHVIFG